MLEGYINRGLNVNSRTDMAGIIYRLDAMLENLEPLCETEKKSPGAICYFIRPVKVWWK